MNAVNIRLARDGHDREVVILALQRYLATHWVRILEDGTDWVVELESKMPSQEPASVQVFLNELIEAEFLVTRERQTADLRRIIMKQALSPYSRGE